MVRYAMRKSTGTKPTGLGRKNTKSSGFSTDMKREAQFVICVGNKGYPASLELRKIYQVIPDKAASRLHQLRVIDESGEDYLYPQDYFVSVLSELREIALLLAADVVDEQLSRYLSRHGIEQTWGALERI